MNDTQSVDILIQCSIRASVILVYSRLIYRLWRRNSDQPHQRNQEYYLWFAGWLLLVLHVILSFHFVHHWHHSDAWNRTARETENLIGVRRGDGLWANYLMLTLWGMDQFRLYKAKKQSRVPSLAVDRVVAVSIGFMYINATVVFGPMFYRYLAFPALLIAVYIWRMHKH